MGTASGTRRMTVAQAVVEYLSQQYTVDTVGGVDYRERLIPGTFGIFGHGNVAGVGQALKQYQQQDPALMPYYQGRNEQAQVHQAVGYARHTRRRQTFAISTSIGPGSSNLLTGAALATANRLPVLLLPSDTFATRAADPVLQQLEQPYAYDITVNDAFRPLSKFFDRVNRPEQLFSAFHHGLRVLTDPAETGAVTISLPQDVQAEALDVPVEFLAEREWRIRRPDADDEDIARAAALIRAAKRPLIIAGGGVLYAYANEELAKFAELTGIPVGNTQAGVGVLPWDHRLSLGAVGSTGTTVANAIAAEADLIIGIGTRYEDFTTASRTAFQNPDVKFVNINVAPIDAYKHGTPLPIVADARKALAKLNAALGGYRVGADLEQKIAAGKKRWNATVDEAFDTRSTPLPAQNEIIGATNRAMDARDVVVCAAGSLPGDLHKMWRVQDPFGYHVEYAYSCMGYEIPGGLGVKRAAIAEAARTTAAGGPGDQVRDVVVMVGDGSYLMMHTELVTAVAERIKLIVVLIQNHGYASIGSLSESLGSQRFGTRYRTLNEEQHSFDDGGTLPVDLALNAESLGVKVIRIEPGEKVIAELEQAIRDAKAAPENSGPVLIHVESDPLLDAPSSEAWWDVPVSQVSELDSTKQAFQTYVDHKSRQRKLLG
ncbi:3D-(3,5/4)-trihydroxycyclohexane-1,2-dione acylhydrolase (decyclizing) [Pseudarthrobacter sp. C4D7]|uniref:3D-(3,5/4)-trihydroxycyclohexane-1,2-dione acylhydrolase (decyclizing) n=1 Tax=Pseudarthrobacter sp. C4D7 TaxID=2735268 RepID=UPI001584D5D0|nr:3D-(3,5/4)-trihydroxycyclohexane-1,2-dione acylhydrolase (decyclizing) [Pseudarthrobacter sp. C4D7]